MASKTVCNFEKFGYCRMKNECKDYHPTEICKNKSCKISRCKRRHPKTCKYFESGYCKFKESCKYEHKMKVDDLLDKILKLERQNVGFREIEEQQEFAIFVLNERLSKLEMENKSLRRELSKDHKKENKSDKETLVSDDELMETNIEYTTMNIPEQNATENLKNQIKFTVEVQTEVEETIKNININDKTFVEAKDILKNFHDKINECVKKPEVQAAFTGQNYEALMKLVDKLNVECNKVLTKSLRTNFFRSFISNELKEFLNELIKMRNPKTNNKRKNIE